MKEIYPNSACFYKHIQVQSTSWTFSVTHSRWSSRSERCTQYCLLIQTFTGEYPSKSGWCTIQWPVCTNIYRWVPVKIRMMHRTVAGLYKHLQVRTRQNQDDAPYSGLLVQTFTGEYLSKSGWCTVQWLACTNIYRWVPVKIRMMHRTVAGLYKHLQVSSYEHTTYRSRDAFEAPTVTPGYCLLTNKTNTWVCHEDEFHAGLMPFKVKELHKDSVCSHKPLLNMSEWTCHFTRHRIDLHGEIAECLSDVISALNHSKSWRPPITLASSRELTFTWWGCRG